MNKKHGAEAYPLYWPDGWARTRWRKDSNFKVSSFARVRDGVIKNIRLMGGKHIVLSTCLSLRLDGLPLANQRNPEDPGVAIYWYDSRAEQQRAMACDKWRTVTANMRAVELSLEALRGLERWGSSEIVERAFSGFTALPEHDPNSGNWRRVFGFVDVPGPSLIAIKVLYKSMARLRHPDHGGSVEAMTELNLAMAAAEKELL